MPTTQPYHRPVIRPGRGRGEAHCSFSAAATIALMCEEPPLCPRAAMVAQVAARTRQAIAKKIAKLVPKVEVDTEAQVVLHLAEAYGHLAIEPPRTRTR